MQTLVLTVVAHGRRTGVRALFLLTPLALAAAIPNVRAQPVATADTIVVTANRTPQPLSSVLADVSVLDRSAIERSGALGVVDLLARLPGIEFARNGGPGTTTSLFIRGSESRHTAVYIDGVRVDSQSTGGAVWEQIPLEQIERIEVLRGPAAAVYGSDAVAGVVQLFTKRGQGAAQPSASLSYGSQNTAQVRAGVSGAAGDFDYSLAAAHGRSDGINSRSAAGANPDRDGWRRHSVQARLGWQFAPAHRVDATLLNSKQRSQYDGFSPGLDDINHHTLRTASLGWQGRWNDTATTRLQLGRTESSYETQPSYYRTETTLDNLTLQHEQRFGNQVLSATLERREDGLVNPFTDWVPTLKGERHQNAVGLGWRGDFGAHGVQLHLRHDEDSEFGGKSSGSLAWGWAFAPAWRVTASAATSFRVPTLYQRFSEYGNPDLVPESGRNVELGLRWAADTSEASLSVWRNKVNELITWGSTGTCPSRTLDPAWGGCYDNTGRARLEGVTLAGRTRLAGVTLNGSLSWHDPRNLDTDTVLQRRARRLATFGAETVLAGWTLGAEVQAAGQRFENAGNTQTMGGYGLVNLVVSKVLLPGLTLEGRIDNAGDKNYELARSYTTTGRSGQVALRWALN